MVMDNRLDRWCWVVVGTMVIGATLVSLQTDLYWFVQIGIDSQIKTDCVRYRQLLVEDVDAN